MIIEIIFFVILSTFFLIFFFSRSKKNDGLGIGALILFLFQFLSFLGMCMSNSFDNFNTFNTLAISGNVAYLIGKYIFAIVSCILIFISYKKQKKEEK